MTDSHTRPLDGLRAADTPRFGGKSTSLGELLAAGIPVPPGFALSTSAFHAFLTAGGLEARIGEAIAGMRPDDVRAVQAAADTIRAAVCATAVPEEVRAEIAAGYAELGEPPVAVRSSAVGEDSAEATFAGQQETYLWVRGADAVCDAVRDCWASTYSAPAMTYRARLASGGAPEMGVTIQRMVDAAVSGVMFTCNPVSGDPSVIAVNASWGLGLAVVGGEVTPDEYLVSRVTREVVRRTISAKHVEYRPAGDGSGTVAVPVAEERRSEPSPGRGAARRARRRRAARAAPLRRPPGRRVGDRARRHAVRPAVAAGDRDGGEEGRERGARAGLGAVDGDEPVRRRRRGGLTRWG